MVLLSGSCVIVSYISAQGVHDGLAPMLLGAGYEVKTFPTVSGFLENAPALVPGCVLLDLRAPAAQAMLLLRELKGRRLELPVVVGNIRKTRPCRNDGNRQRCVAQHPASMTDPHACQVLAHAFAHVLCKVARERTPRKARSRAQFR